MVLLQRSAQRIDLCLFWINMPTKLGISMASLNSIALFMRP